MDKLALIGSVINRLSEAFWSLREFTKEGDPEIVTAHNPKILNGFLLSWIQLEKLSLIEC